MKEYISIRNFGPIKDINQLQLKNVTILIGESAIGKSTLMKISALMRYLYKMANIRSYLRLSNITRSPFKIKLDTLMKKSGLIGMLTTESEISYIVVSNSGQQYEILIKGKKLDTLPLISEDDLIFSKVSYVSENRNVIPMWAERAASNQRATLGFYFNETNNDFAMATEQNLNVDLNYMNMKLHVTHPKGKVMQIRVEHSEDGNLSFNLHEASSGVQTSVPLKLIVNYFAHSYSFKDAFSRSVLKYLHDIERLTKFKAVSEPSSLKKMVYVHVEEPELSLFPTAQCKLMDELILTADRAENDRNVNLMFATHSPYILSYMNVVLHQNKENRAHVDPENMAVYRLYNGEAINLMVRNEDGISLVDTYDLTETMSDIYQEFKSF